MLRACPHYIIDVRESSAAESRAPPVKNPKKFKEERQPPANSTAQGCQIRLMRAKRRMFIIVGILVILAILGVGGYLAVSYYNKTITELRDENDDLKMQLEDAQIEMGTVVAVGPVRTNDQGEIVFDSFKDGERILPYDEEGNSYDLVYIDIPADVITDHMITDMEDVKGKITKIDLLPGAILETTMLMDYELKADDRELDIVLDEMPIGLEPGDYVDLRISFPLGQDFVVMVKKQVVAINSNTIKLIVNEEDVHHYESVKADKSLYQSTKLYTTKYVEYGLQPAAASYYPVTNEVLQTLIKDPNINTDDWQKNFEARFNLEMELASLEWYDENGEKHDDVAFLLVNTTDTSQWNINDIQQVKNLTDEEYATIKALYGVPYMTWPGNRVDKDNKVTTGRSDLLAKYDQSKQNFEQLQAEKAREQRYYNY